MALTAPLFGACGAPESADDGSRGKVCGRVVLDGGDAIPDPPDGASLCPAGACNYQTQEGCSDDTTCQPYFTNGGDGFEATCLPAGDRAGGDACDADNPCARGYACAGGTCRKLCCGRDWSACDAGESCFRELQLRIDGEPVATGAWLCFPIDTCNVLDSEACSGGAPDCKIVDPTGNEACIPPSPEQLFEPCSGPSVCARGLTCVGGFCRRLCAAEQCGEPSCPPSEGACVHFNRNPPGVGECTPGW